MQTRISKKIKKLILKLSKKGISKPKIAKQTRVSYTTVYGLTSIIKKGFKSYHEYNKYLAEKKGLTLSEYQEGLAKARQKKPINRELSDLIKERLKELGKTRIQLAEEIEISRVSVDNYAKGRSIPNEKNLEKLFNALDLSFETSDYFVNKLVSIK